jgi:hypothetical protein
VRTAAAAVGYAQKFVPTKNIELVEGNPVWKHNCEQCASCIQYCPREAIQWGKKTVRRKRYRNSKVNVNELIGCILQD